MYGLVFDLDGVITDTAKFHYIAWKELAASIDIEIDEAFNEQLKGVSRRDSLMRILVHGKKENQFTEAAIQDMLVQKNERYLLLLEKLTPTDILPGVLDLLKQAKELNYKTAIASASLNAPHILEKLEIKQYFDAIVNPNDLAKSKPDPEIFTKAIEMIDVLPEHAIGFEDAQAGVDGLKSANIYTVGVITHGALTHTDLNVMSLTEFNLQEVQNLLKK